MKKNNKGKIANLIKPSLESLKSKSFMQQLEPRLMYDGAAIISADQAVNLSDGSDPSEQESIIQAFETNEKAKAAESVYTT